MADTALLPPTDGIRLPERPAATTTRPSFATRPSTATIPSTETDAAPHRFRMLGLVVVFVTQLMLVVDASIVNVALPDIQKSLGFTPIGLSWVVTAYALAFAGLMLLSGKVGSMIGAKRALIIGTVIFILASAAGGLAPSAAVLIIARIVQGVGAAIAAPSTLVLLMANTSPGRQRSRAMALFMLAAGSGGAIGLILGGVLTTGFGWEWVMFVNVPVGILIVAGALLFLRETDREQTRLDFGGAVASTLGMVALIYGFTTAAGTGWTNPVALIAFAIAVASLIALVFIERKHRSPVVPLRLFRGARNVAPLVAMLLVPAGMFAFFYFITLFTQQVLHFTPLETGLGLLPFVVTMVTVSQLVPRLLPRVGEWIVGAAGLFFLAGGLLWLSRLSEHDSFVTGILGPLVVMGLGAGMTFAPITAVAMDRAPEEHVSAASSVLQTMQQLGGSIGVAALTTVFVSVSATSGETGGVAAAVLGGATFVFLGFVLFAVWGSRVRADGDRTDAPAPIAH
ncbi:MFS transporter [Planctomonas sp. JC2975]|uniref:MFS transporter n=1 Tax=Planctomonas sp. JC2975 TaxID=2729626 RepID=UPI00147594C9|nr:MFS transporter [Planctomonas sp. JC2975]NNC12339.1 MFS transporter [Planctomonas sp. JC2975]